MVYNLFVNDVSYFCSEFSPLCVFLCNQVWLLDVVLQRCLLLMNLDKKNVFLHHPHRHSMRKVNVNDHKKEFMPFEVNMS